jgi:hypothetical protein
VPSTPVAPAIAAPTIVEAKPALEAEPTAAVSEKVASEKVDIKPEEAQPISASVAASPASSKPMPLPPERPVQAASVVQIPNAKSTPVKAVEAAEESEDDADEAPKPTNAKVLVPASSTIKVAPKDMPMPPVRQTQGQRAFHMQDTKSNKS